MYYYDPHSDLNLSFDAEQDEFKLRRLYHEIPDKLGYIPSYR